MSLSATTTTLMGLEDTLSASGAAVAWLFFAVVCTYLLLAMKRFYAQTWARTGLKFAGVGFVYSVFVLLPAFGGLLAASVIYG
jgi:type II secretory pathway component PulF